MLDRAGIVGYIVVQFSNLARSSSMTAYWPSKTDWQRTAPQDAGFSPAAVSEAVDYAIRHESAMDRNIRNALDEGHFAEPWPVCKIIGPVKDRAEPSGLIVRGGRIVSEWGEIERVDMTFSATKSYLALCAGIAVDDGLIPDIHAPVRDLVNDGGFESEQNRKITWAHLLQLTSEWQGTLWDKPDSVDHNRNLAARPGDAAGKGVERKMQTPGTHWEYNDVRVNRLALALLRVFRRPLPDVLKERIMDPIGASETWQWHGYENSYVEIDGQRMQSVSGGAHWGGGLWISTLDHARIGLLMLRGGAWKGRQLISEHWIKTCLTPCPLNRSYGLMWWLNTTGETAPAAPRTSFFARGVGSNIVWIDPDNGNVVVVRWIERDDFPGFAEKVMAAIR